MDRDQVTELRVAPKVDGLFGRDRRTAKGWNVILPIDVVECRFEGL
jgi:hypothetical protein